MGEGSIIEFTVPGVPAPQGNKTAYVRGGRAVLVEGRRPEARQHFQSWRNAVAFNAAQAAAGEILIGPVELDVRFFFPRPKSHYGQGRNATVVKQFAPRVHTGKPDLDKLIRAIGDALTGAAIKDDSQIAVVRAVKAYGDAGAHIVLRPVESLNQALGRAA